MAECAVLAEGVGDQIHEVVNFRFAILGDVVSVWREIWSRGLTHIRHETLRILEVKQVLPPILCRHHFRRRTFRFPPMSAMRWHCSKAYVNTWPTLGRNAMRLTLVNRCTMAPKVIVIIE